MLVYDTLTMQTTQRTTGTAALTRYESCSRNMGAYADNYWDYHTLLVARDNLHLHDKVAVCKGVEEHTTAAC